MQAIYICRSIRWCVVTRDNTIVPQNLFTFHKKILCMDGYRPQNELYETVLIHPAQQLVSEGLMDHDFGGLTWESHTMYTF